MDNEEMGEGDGKGAADGEFRDRCLPEMMDAVAASEASTDVEDDIVMNRPLTSDTRVVSSDTCFESSPPPGMKRKPLEVLYGAPRARVLENAVPSRVSLSADLSMVSFGLMEWYSALRAPCS